MAEQISKVKGVVDVVFLLDATGSMQSCIDALKSNIGIFIDSLVSKGPNNSNPVKEWRAKAVGYRDYKYDAVPFIDNPFVTDADALKTQLAGLVADGGNDEPESLLDALYEVASMEQTPKGGPLDHGKWRYRSEAARVIVAFTDASYHETMTLSRVKGGSVTDVINVFHSNRIILSLFAPEMACHDRLAEADKSDYFAIPLDGKSPQDALRDFTGNQENFKRTMEALARSVSKSAETPAL